MLFDTERERVLVIDGRAWWVLGEADGTRDLPGIVAAARRRGATWTATQVERFFADLDAQRLLVDGAPASLVAGEAAPRHADDTRPIVVMPGSEYVCDGRGGCCRSYATIAFVPADVHRACASAPLRGNAAHDPTRMFLPITGSAPTPIRAVTLVDGACAYLEADGACELHRIGGIDNKPVGCRWFPAQLVDDGEAIRAAPSIECVCPARPHPSGAPLVPETMRTPAALPTGVVIGRVPERVRIVDDVEGDRAPACAAIDRFVATLDDVDVARALWGWSIALGDAQQLVEHGRPPSAVAVARISSIAGLIAARASARASAEALWRAADHPVCTRLRAIATAASVLGSPTAAGALVELRAADPELEARVVRAAAFVRAWLERGPLATRLAELAMQLWIARALPAFVGEDADVTLRETPLAAVLAVWRTCGLARALGSYEEVQR